MSKVSHNGHRKVILIRGNPEDIILVKKETLHQFFIFFDQQVLYTYVFDQLI